MESWKEIVSFFFLGNFNLRSCFGSGIGFGSALTHRLLPNCLQHRKSAPIVRIHSPWRVHNTGNNWNCASVGLGHLYKSSSDVPSRFGFFFVATVLIDDWILFRFVWTDLLGMDFGVVAVFDDVAVTNFWIDCVAVTEILEQN